MEQTPRHILPGHGNGNGTGSGSGSGSAALSGSQLLVGGVHVYVHVHVVHPSLASQLPASELFGAGAVAVAAPG